ncbi:MAG TPA: sugar transferase [Solirubrobacteraceae bacterium]|nr:sugar transferase [Solirubrobacteraceae bacterium]
MSSFPEISKQTTTTPIPLQRELRASEVALDHRAQLVRRRAGLLQWLLEEQGWRLLRPLVDVCAAVAAGVIALGGPDATAHLADYDKPLLALPALVMVLLYTRGLYRSHLRTLFLDTVVPVAAAVSIAAMLVLALGLFADDHSPGQGTWLRDWLITLALVAGGRALLSLGQRWARARRMVGRPVLILGAGIVGTQIAKRLEAHPEYGLWPAGFLDDEPRSLEEIGECAVPVIGSVAEVDEIVARTGVEHLIVAFSSTTDSRVSPLVQRCQELGIEVSVVPRMFDTINNRIDYDAVGGLPLLSLRMVSPTGFQFALKHAFDRIVAAILLILLAPVMASVALAVRLTSRGPILFRQRRVGRDGKLFDLYKFRSMRVSEPVAEGAGKAAEGTRKGSLSWRGRDMAPGGIEGVDRRTPIGRFIRSTALDELPQLFNVLRGEMSLVGPRPERPEFVELFREEIARYGDRHRVKSGITGWAQVHGLRGKTSLAERVEWDNYYIAHWSIGLDLKILVMTIFALFHGAE